MNKKIIAIIAIVALVGVLAVGLSACDNKTDKVVTVGYTIYEPMNYMDSNNNLVGFDTDLAKAVFEELGYKVVFKEINWNNKYIDLNSGNITCIWNGFTTNSKEEDGSERSDLVDFSYKYMINKQCVVAKVSETATTVADLNRAEVVCAYEAGSAATPFVSSNFGNCTPKEALSQMDAIKEVNAGTSRIAVVDFLLATRIAGKGDFQNLKVIESIDAAEEQYAIAFKKGDKLRDDVNKTLEKFLANGKLLEIAQKYNLEGALIKDYTIYD